MKLCIENIISEILNNNNYEISINAANESVVNISYKHENILYIDLNCNCITVRTLDEFKTFSQTIREAKNERLFMQIIKAYYKGYQQGSCKHY